MKRFTIACSIVLAGCATAPPNTPGAGFGDTYTPFIDLDGVNMARYYADLGSCRAYAQQIDAARAEQQGLLAGMIAGALVGAAVGGDRYYTEHAAIAGGLGTMGAAGARARNKQELILANCMAGRGYRVLEGASQPTATNVPSPYLNAPVAAPAAPAAPAQAVVPPAPAVAPNAAIPSAAPPKRLPSGVTSCLGCQ